MMTASLLLGGDPSDEKQAAIDLDAVRAAKRVTAVRVSEPIAIDGHLDEPAWDQTEPATDFYQQQPAEFAPAMRRTEVRFLYDDTTLYVGAMLYDDEPHRLITNDLKRDFSGRDTDSFAVVLDTFQDRRSAYGFLANPGGAQRDTQSSDNGRRLDANWHGVWTVRTSVRENGWCVEIAIPFKTLRFPERPVQEWGLNLMRVTRRDNETTTWAPVPRQFSHYNVAYAGTLQGIEGVRPGGSVMVKPFLTGEVRNHGSQGPGWRGEPDGGVDLKWGITSSLLLDATSRTDFSQVEADEQQLNLTRFSLFFPEKRDFFLESPGSFQIGIAEPDDEARRDLVPFFSRRIGLSDDGHPVPVFGGLRLTGTAGPWGIGMFTMRTEEFERTPADTFSAFRMTRTIAPSATLGAFYFGREGAGAGGFNRVAGFDLRVTPRRMLEVEAFGMRSVATGTAGDWAGRAGMRLDGSAHRARAGLVHVGDSIRDDLGYVRRHGIATAFGTYDRVFRPAKTTSRLRDHSIGVTLEATANDRYSAWLTRIGGVNYKVVFNDGAEFQAAVTSTFERLDEPFGLGEVTVAPGEYRYENATITYQSNKSATLSGNVEATAGEFWNGRQAVVGGGLRMRVNAHFASSVTLRRSHIDLPDGAFTGDLFGFRADWSFSPRMFLNAFIQYNGQADTWIANIKYNFIHRPLSDIYVVWNETRVAGTIRRALLLKYTHLIAF